MIKKNQKNNFDYMSVDDQIKHLEEERDHLLSTTPLERIPNKNKGFHTNHSNIKAKYNSKITNLKKYGVDNPFKLKEVQDQIKQTNLNRYGFENASKSKIVRDKLVKSSALANIKRYETKKKNNSFHISKSEERIGNLLDNLFIHLGGIKRQYKSDLYPFACDFYIPCLDLYIECHFTWLHGGHPFDSSNQDDLYLVEKWKSKNTKYYNNAIYTWTDLDVRKLNALKNNKLNYIIFYKENDFYKWLEEEIL